MAIDYDKKAAEGKYTDKPPFHDMEGSFIVVILSDNIINERKLDDVNICKWRILKVLEGPTNVVGKTFTRRRPAKSDGTSDEWQNRYCTALSMSMRLRKKGGDPRYEFPRANYTGAILKTIHEGGGEMISGYPIRVESKQVDMKTKAGQFTVCTYHFPTAAELEGISLNDDGQVIG